MKKYYYLVESGRVWGKVLTEWGSGGANVEYGHRDGDKILHIVGIATLQPPSNPIVKRVLEWENHPETKGCQTMAEFDI